METLSINIIKMRDAFLKKHSDLSFSNLSIKLKELLDSGAITEEEFKKAKDKILKN